MYQFIAVVRYNTYYLHALKKPSYTSLQKQLQKTKKQMRALLRKQKTITHQQTEPETIEVKTLQHVPCTVTVADIAYLQADRNTTNVFVAANNRLHTYYLSYNLHHALQKLPKQKFIRSHFSFAANISFLKSIIRGKNTQLQLLFEAVVPVAKRRKSLVLQFIKKFKR